ncbi:MAG: acyl carrier protein [Methylobacillus sp.]|nr:acyl carrier protein [Methylobacillus sp.]
MKITSAMGKEEIYALVAKELHEMFEIDPSRLVPEAHLYTDLDIDSIDAVDLVVRLNQITGKRFQPETFKAVRTVDDVVNAVAQLIRENNP